MDSKKCNISVSALDCMHPRAVSFEEQATIVREKLADLLVEDDEFSAAARILAGIDLESGMRQVITNHSHKPNPLPSMFGFSW